jgi:hypothetical protein
MNDEKKLIFNKFLDCMQSELSVEIDRKFMSFSDRKELSLSIPAKSNALLDLIYKFDDWIVFDFSFNEEDIIIESAQLSKIYFDHNNQSFFVGGYIFRFFELKNVGMSI